jgi:hypothetical protein
MKIGEDVAVGVLLKTPIDADQRPPRASEFDYLSER